MSDHNISGAVLDLSPSLAGRPRRFTSYVELNVLQVLLLIDSSRNCETELAYIAFAITRFPSGLRRVTEANIGSGIRCGTSR